jgi:tetratricopeptide (TPR) repeat protein
VLPPPITLIACTYSRVRSDSASPRTSLDTVSHRSTARLFDAQSDTTRALFHARRALRIYRAAGDRTGQAAALNGVGWYYAVLGNNQRALSYCGRALELYREAGNRSGEGATLDSLGYCHHQSGHHGQAEAFYQQALGAYADLGDRSCRAHTLIHLAETHQATGDQAAARSLWRQAIAILDELHHHDADAVRAKLREGDRNPLPDHDACPGPRCG